MKKIIIFGANGGVGKYLVDYFLSNDIDNYQIIGVGRRPEPSFLGKIEYLQLDITKQEDTGLCHQ